MIREIFEFPKTGPNILQMVEYDDTIRYLLFVSVSNKDSGFIGYLLRASATLLVLSE